MVAGAKRPTLSPSASVSSSSSNATERDVPRRESSGGASHESEQAAPPRNMPQGRFGGNNNNNSNSGGSGGGVRTGVTRRNNSGSGGSGGGFKGAFSSFLHHSSSNSHSQSSTSSSHSSSTSTSTSPTSSTASSSRTATRNTGSTRSSSSPSSASTTFGRLGARSSGSRDDFQGGRAGSPGGGSGFGPSLRGKSGISNTAPSAPPFVPQGSRPPAQSAPAFPAAGQAAASTPHSLRGGARSTGASPAPNLLNAPRRQGVTLNGSAIATDSGESANSSSNEEIVNAVGGRNIRAPAGAAVAAGTVNPNRLPISPAKAVAVGAAGPAKGPAAASSTTSLSSTTPSEVTPSAVQAATFALLSSRGEDSSICPSEVARKVDSSRDAYVAFGGGGTALGRRASNSGSSSGALSSSGGGGGGGGSYGAIGSDSSGVGPGSSGFPTERFANLPTSSGRSQTGSGSINSASASGRGSSRSSSVSSDIPGETTPGPTVQPPPGAPLSAGVAWRDLMPLVRKCAQDMAEEGSILVTQGHGASLRTVDLASGKVMGPIRLRRGELALTPMVSGAPCSHLSCNRRVTGPKFAEAQQAVQA